MVTAIESISTDSRSLLPMIIWPAATHRSNWTTYPTPGWHYACSESGYTDSKISLKWLKRVFGPHTKARSHHRPRILICDGFGTHETLEILQYCFENNIILCCVPSHTSHKLQPCDIGVFGPLKAAYREQVERLYRGGLDTVGKEHFTSLYSPAREKAITSKNIKAGWIKAGLFPLSPDRVLRDVQKPDAKLSVPKADETKMRSSQQSEILQTPVKAEGFTALHSLIKQDAPDEISRQRLQKLANAVQISFAQCALLHDESQHLFEQNDEAKRRRSTKSTVVGEAKVMSYEDLEMAQAKRAAKEAAKDGDAAKGRRGRKRKIPVTPKERKARKSEVEIAKDEIAVGGMGGLLLCSQL